jgi:trk system potassium uptake protein TrkA
MGKNYAVLGLGAFGYQMAVSLQEGGGQVLAVDLDERVIQHISPYVSKAAVADISDRRRCEAWGSSMWIRSLSECRITSIARCW